jgi:hypothetical protein
LEGVEGGGGVGLMTIEAAAHGAEVAGNTLTRLVVLVLVIRGRPGGLAAVGELDPLTG